MARSKSKKKKSSGDGIEMPKPQFSVYTAMLILAFLAITTGVGLLFLELGTYNYEYNGPVSSLTSGVDTSARHFDV